MGGSSTAASSSIELRSRPREPKRVEADAIPLPRVTRVGAGSAPVDRDDLDGTRRAAERDGSRLRDREPAVDRGGPASKDLVAVGERRDPGGLVDALAREVLPDLRRARGMEPDPDLGREPGSAPMLGQPALDRDRAPERLIG